MRDLPVIRADLCCHTVPPCRRPGGVVPLEFSTSELSYIDALGGERKGTGTRTRTRARPLPTPWRARMRSWPSAVH